MPGGGIMCCGDGSAGPVTAAAANGKDSALLTFRSEDDLKILKDDRPNFCHIVILSFNQTVCPDHILSLCSPLLKMNRRYRGCYLTVPGPGCVVKIYYEEVNTLTWMLPGLT
jgi:hypothetical protein